MLVVLLLLLYSIHNVHCLLLGTGNILRFISFRFRFVYSDTKIDQILTVYRKHPVESKSVEIFGLSLMVFELEAFHFQIFNSVHLQCNDLS